MLGCDFRESTWRQIKIHKVYVIIHGAIKVSSNQVYCQLFPIGFVASVVLNFDMKVKTALATVVFLTIFVRTDIRPVYLFSGSSDVLFSHFLLQVLRT
jgi:hypothetical protein